MMYIYICSSHVLRPVVYLKKKKKHKKTFDIVKRFMIYVREQKQSTTVNFAVTYICLLFGYRRENNPSAITIQPYIILYIGGTRACRALIAKIRGTIRLILSPSHYYYYYDPVSYSDKRIKHPTLTPNPSHPRRERNGFRAPPTHTFYMLMGVPLYIYISIRERRQ